SIPHCAFRALWHQRRAKSNTSSEIDLLACCDIGRRGVSGNQCVRVEFLEARIHFPSEHADPVHGVVMVEKSGLAHDQELAVAADMIPVLLELLEHLIGCAGEHGTGLDRTLHGALPGAMSADHVMGAAG